TAIITDDDPPPTVSFNASSSSGLESTAAVFLLFSLSAASSNKVAVASAVSGGSATGGGVDYTLASGTLSFAPGVTNLNISLTVRSEERRVGKESRSGCLPNPTNASVGSTAPRTYATTEYDGPPMAT